MQKPETSQRQSASRSSLARRSRAELFEAGNSGYPAAAAASNQREGRVAAADHTTRARWLAALTCASSTPGTCSNAASTVNAQAAQCMPSTAICDSHRPVPASPSSKRPNTGHSAESSSTRHASLEAGMGDEGGENGASAACIAQG